MLEFEKPNPQLVSLPPEIIDCTVRNLDLADLRSFRATCKALAAKSLHYFSRAYFDTASTNLSLTSVQRLHDIARSEWAAKHVQTLKLEWDEEAGVGLTWQRDASGALLAELPVIHQLSRVLSRLPNCQSIHVRAAYEIEPDVESTSLDVIGYSDILSICFILIAGSNMHLLSFNLDFGRSGGVVRVNPNRIHLEQIQKPGFQEAWSNLEELSLRVRIDNRPSRWLMDLVSSASFLRRLSWMAEIDNPIYLHADSFTFIQVLELETGRIDQSELTTLLQQCCKSLQILKIYNFHVQGYWVPVLEFARDNCPCLENISLIYLKNEVRRLCTFTGLENTPDVFDLPKQGLQLTKRGIGEKKVVGVSYIGPGVPKVLDILRRAINE